MYARYSKTIIETGATHYVLQDSEISLFGKENGFIPWLLKLKLKPEQGEPYKWHADVMSELGSNSEYPNSTLVIDLKPKQSETNLSLYEVMDVWGVSDQGWSPILLRLKGLFIDATPSSFNGRTLFVRTAIQ